MKHIENEYNTENNSNEYDESALAHELEDAVDHSVSTPHTHSDGHTHSHPHDPDHPHVHHHHAHVHDPKEKRRQINRLSRVIGHLEYVKRMIEDDEDCSDVLMQIAAAKSALNGLGKQIIGEHLEHCVAHAVEEGDTEALEEFQKAIQKYI